MSAVDVTFTVNGRQASVAVDPAETLLEVLRERLRLTGTKEGCNEGECGACTVLVDGLPLDSCIYCRRGRLRAQHRDGRRPHRR